MWYLTFSLLERRETEIKIPFTSELSFYSKRVVDQVFGAFSSTQRRCHLPTSSHRRKRAPRRPRRPYKRFLKLKILSHIIDEIGDFHVSDLHKKKSRNFCTRRFVLNPTRSDIMNV